MEILLLLTSTLINTLRYPIQQHPLITSTTITPANMHLTLPTSLLIAAVGRVSAGYDAGSHKNLAVYWGANSVGPNAPEESWQGPLVEYCKAPEVDVCDPRHQYDHY
jgi:hypothetical protein